MKRFVIHVFVPKIGVIQHITWAIGKDHAQDRIARAHPDKNIRFLSVGH